MTASCTVPHPPEDPPLVQRTGGRVVGVDLGIKSLAVLSTGEVVPNSRHLDGALGALRRVQRTCTRRRGPDRRTHQVPSSRWRKATARVTALHTWVGNQRRDGLHKLTTRLTADYHTIVIEDLHVAGMVRNRRLARALCGLGIAELRRQIEYKAADAGVRVAPGFPNSTAELSQQSRATLLLSSGVQEQGARESRADRTSHTRDLETTVVPKVGRITPLSPLNAPGVGSSSHLTHRWGSAASPSVEAVT